MQIKNYSSIKKHKIQNRNKFQTKRCALYISQRSREHGLDHGDVLKAKAANLTISSIPVGFVEFLAGKTKRNEKKKKKEKKEKLKLEGSAST